MTLAELVFLLVVGGAVLLLALSGVRVAQGRRVEARRWLTIAALGAASYVLALIAASVLLPPPDVELGRERCFDDWCLTVTDAVRRAGASGEDDVRVEFRLTNRARRAPMGERGTVAYLVDERGRRYEALDDPSQPRFDRVLQPGESIATLRRYRAPSTAAGLGVVYAHEGVLPIEWLFLGEGGWFGHPAAVRIPPAQADRGIRP